MKKTFKLVDLDCANCAQKMEDAINKLPGVTAATVSFMTQKLTIEAEDVDAVMKDVVRCVRKWSRTAKWCCEREQRPRSRKRRRRKVIP